jgi:plasmid stabilization system protein ParE
MTSALQSIIIYRLYAQTAIKQLDEIADWNEQHYGAAHAAQYIEFLEKNIDALCDKYELGLKFYDTF